MRTATRRALALLVGLLVALTGVAASGVAAGGPPGERRVLLIAVPGLRWEDLDRPELPTLRALLDRSAVASLSPRVTRTVARPGEAYLTLGAGTRAVASSFMAGFAYSGEERVGVGSAAEEFARQQGSALPDGGVAVLSWPMLLQENQGSDFDAALGGLGTALSEAGVGRGVVGNADIVDPVLGGQLVLGREVALGLADASGSVPCGDVSQTLLESDPGAPFGQRLDVEAATDAFARCWEPGSVVLVEASDLRRAAAFEARAATTLSDAARQDALVRTDDLVRALLAKVDQDRDAVVVLSPTTGATPGLGILGVSARELPSGLLTSGSTRHPGNVLLADVTPTVAALAGVAMDEAGLEGRRVEPSPDQSTPASRRARLVDDEAAAQFRDRMLEPVVLAYVTAVSALVLVAAAAFVWGLRGLVPWLERVALALVAFPVGTYLAALLPFERWGAAAYWAWVGGAALVLGGLADLLRRRWLAPLVVTYGGLLAVIVASVVLLGSRLQTSTVFGDSPIVAGRFSGINNVTFALLMGSTIVLATVIIHLVPGQRGRRAMVAFLVAALAVDVAPMWGADVGGALAGLPALAVVATGLGRWKVRWRTVALTALATLLLLLLLGLLDLMRAPADRSHLGRLFERVASEGLPGFTTVVQRKLGVNLRSLSTSSWRFVFGPLAAAAALVAWRARAQARAVAEALPGVVHVAPGLAAAALLGYAANDSGIAVPGALLAFVAPGLVYLACRVHPPSTDRAA